MTPTKISKLIRWGGIASMLGSLVGCTRVFFKRDVFSLWGFDVIDLVFGLALLLWSLGLMGFWTRHVYVEKKPSSRWFSAFASGIFAFYGSSLPHIVVGDPTYYLFYFPSIVIMGAYCLAWNRLGKWSTLPFVTVLIGLCSWIPAFVMFLSETTPGHWLRLIITVLAFLFSLSWGLLGYAVLVNTEIPLDE